MFVLQTPKFFRKSSFVLFRAGPDDWSCTILRMLPIRSAASGTDKSGCPLRFLTTVGVCGIRRMRTGENPGAEGE